MVTRFFMKDVLQHTEPKEGDLYKRMTVFGKSFELRYGYYEEFERQYNEPMPIYPDFLQAPLYTDDGFPFVTQMQDACIHYIGKEERDQDCAGCVHYLHGEEFLGVCSCPQNRKQPK